MVHSEDSVPDWFAKHCRQRARIVCEEGGCRERQSREGALAGSTLNLESHQNADRANARGLVASTAPVRGGARVQHHHELVQVDESHPIVVRLGQLGALVVPVCLRRVLRPWPVVKVDNARLHVRLQQRFQRGVCPRGVILTQEEGSDANKPAAAVGR